MKAPIRVLIGLVLCAFSLSCSMLIGLVQAMPGQATESQSAPSVASTLSVPLRPEWRLGAPFTHRNLTVFPVLADQPAARADLITLDEGLRSGKVIITERGANGRSRRINSRRVRDDADVNELALTNKSGRALILIAGEMIIGGKQDRIVGHDCIIEASNTPVPLDVFCVEQGRWSGEAEFGENVVAGRPRRNRRGSGSGYGYNSGGGVGPGSGASRGIAPSLGMTPAIVAPLALPNIREKAQARKDQSDVWAAVNETVTVNSTATSTGTLTSVYRDNRVNARAAGYERAFKSKLTGRNIVGVVAAVGERVVSADVFANPSLFRAYWPKLMKSFALQAGSETKARGKQANKSDAEAFLARVQGESNESGENSYRLAENQTSAHASFELVDTRKTPTLIHFNRVAKK